ncbi:MAG TPA: lytic transglycosylase domain-containing protein [Rhizomicrobium sp.]|nr:lytic transglycosylase domain-containing protein [Rhizomicrobium sp.]
MSFAAAFLALACATAQAQPAVPPAPVTPVNPAPPSLSIAPHILSPGDVALYRQIMTAERAGRRTQASALAAQLSDPVLLPYAQALRFLSGSGNAADLADWLRENRETAIADRVYRQAVRLNTRTVRRGKKRIKVAVVTNIPAPAGVGSRTGGYEDQEQPEPTPFSDAGKQVMPSIFTAIRAGQPDQARALMDGARAALPPVDVAILTHRIAASYRAESRDADAYALAITVSDPAVPQLLWDAGFAAYRMGHWPEAIRLLEKLAETPTAQNNLRAQGALWAARAHMQAGDPHKVVTLLDFAAGKQPSFYGILAERILGMDTQTGFADAILNQGDFNDLMAVPAARRAVALWQIGESEFVGPELNRAFVNNNERLDPAMAALARGIGVPNVELRAAEKSAARGIVLTSLFPVPPYSPDGGYRIDSSLVLAFARIESRFQVSATSPVGARGLMQIMPGTARHLGVNPDSLSNPSASLAAGQRYIEMLLNQLDGSLLELGGAYNAGPGAVSRWRSTKAGGDDPLLFVESIPVAETRSYVKRLMLYHWHYRRRFGQEARSLEEAARGQWPVYRPGATAVSAPLAGASGLRASADR